MPFQGPTLQQQIERVLTTFPKVRILAIILAIVFVAETGIMFVLPVLLPPSIDETRRAIVDSLLLTLLTAPILWLVIIGPLRRIALSERAKAASIVESAADGILTIDDEGIIQTFNHAAETIFGFSAEEMIGRNVTHLIPDELAERHRCGLQGYAQTLNVIAQTIEATGRRKDGNQFPVALSISEVRYDGRLAFTGIIRDLTERKSDEAALKKHADQQATVAELGQRALAGNELQPLMNTVVARVAETFEVEFCAVFKLQPDEDTIVPIAGNKLDDTRFEGITISADACAANGVELLADEPVVFERLAAGAMFKQFPMPDDAVLISGISVLIHAHDGLFGVLVVFSTETRTYGEFDVHFLQAVANVITTALERERIERAQREREMLRAEQRAAVAQVATGVAHELRNPLTAIKLLVQSNMTGAEAGGMVVEDLRLIEQEIRRMELSLNTFLEFARPSVAERLPLKLNSVVDKLLALIKGRANKQNVDVVFRQDTDTILVEADEGQLHQLLLNLALNALDAMPAGGRLCLTLQVTGKRQALLCVCDTGIGFADDVLPKLFEPFFTTKQTGVGLGLVICRRIAEDHDGQLSARNRENGGACFELALPIYKEPPANRAASVAFEAEPK